MSPELCEKLGVTVLPLSINFSGHIYKDGFDLGHTEFYEMLRKARKLPTTSQINPGEFEAAFRRELADGSDIVGIFLSSGLSGTFQSAHIAATAVSPDRIFLVDSRVVSFGMGILIGEAVKMRDSGQHTASGIAKELQRLALRMRILAVVDTLKYLKMGGRVTAGEAAVGGVLGITPVVQLYGGTASVIGKVRGEKAALKAILDYMKKYKPDYRYPFGFGHADAEEKMKHAIRCIKPYIGNTPIYTGRVGSAIGTHTGPGVFAVGYIAAGE